MEYGKKGNEIEGFREPNCRQIVDSSISTSDKMSRLHAVPTK